MARTAAPKVTGPRLQPRALTRVEAKIFRAVVADRQPGFYSEAHRPLVTAYARRSAELEDLARELATASKSPLSTKRKAIEDKRERAEAAIARLATKLRLTPQHTSTKDQARTPAGVITGSDEGHGWREDVSARRLN